LFARLADRRISRQENVIDRKQDNNLYDNAIAKNLEKQIQERTRIQNDLESDNRNLENDRDTIVALEARRQQEVDEMLAKIERLKTEQEILRGRLGEITRRAVAKSGDQRPTSASTAQPVTVQQPAIMESVLEPTLVQPFPATVAQPFGQPINGTIINQAPQPFIPTDAQPLRRTLPPSAPMPDLSPPMLEGSSLRSFEVFE
jgi:hypothetical protein